MDKRSVNIQKSWDKRQKILGNTKRSVLCKNLPSFLNNFLHQQHSKFITDHIHHETKTVLDLGCGYGRIAQEVIKNNPELKISGVELCKSFSEEFSKKFHECFNGAIQEYYPKQTFDTILMVTILMYVQKEELLELLNRYWLALPVGGQMICIDQSENVLINLRRKFLKVNLQPTGGNVHYFHTNELKQLFLKLRGAKLQSYKNFGLFPLINWPVIHTGIVIQKVA